MSFLLRRTRITPVLSLPRRCLHAIADNDPFHRVDLRIGKITKVDTHPDAGHLYVEKVEVGEPNDRTIVSGLRPFMSMEALENKLVIVVSNMKPSKFRGIRSEGMLLAASSPASSEGAQSQQQQLDRVELLHPQGDIGERVLLESVEPAGEPDPVLKPKQNVFPEVAEHLRTDEQGVVRYKGHALVTTAGLIKASLINSPIS
ncbi:hypothetical protein BCR43DRAFT_95568 [Syncephalastrum racemosum]|uniref:tRNA-binding domain-containing protein n=1 Tax=Syncephalastrum racemosum TaxID=13706 RepID=A0A1X2H137_SYNRA|nr:hypothetical protein BCR43DRAFT_95568 [Syncephalastrum racemosum]